MDILNDVPLVGISLTDATESGENFYITNRNISLNAALDAVTIKGDYCEFGVFQGLTAKQILVKMPKKKKNVKLHLFDSFNGLPEDWMYFSKGKFKLEDQQLPTFKDERVQMHIGLFDETLPKFKQLSNDILAFVHIDCDLYSSTKTVLDNIGHRFGNGTIIQFDEYYNIGDVEKHEQQAFHEFINKTGKTFEYIHRSPYSQVCVRITS